MSEETVTFNLELNVEHALSDIRRFETLMFRTLGLVRRLCGDETIDAAINKVQQFVMVVRLAHSAWIAFSLATGPLGWAMAIVSGLTAASVASDFILSR